MLFAPSRDDLLVAAGAGVTGLAGNAVATGIASDAFLVTSLDDVLVAVTPDPVVRFSIQQLGTVGHQLFVAGAIATTIAVLAVAGLLGRRVAASDARRGTGVVVTAGFAAAFVIAITRSPLAAAAVGVSSALAVALPAVLALAHARFGTAPASTSLDRRRAIEFVGSVGVLAAVGSATGVLRTKRDYERVGGATPQTMLQQADATSFDVDGLGGLISTRAAHYEVDINAVDPSVNADSHEIAITGAVDDERTVSIQDLRDLPTDHRYNTLRCVGDDLNGEKIDTAVWTGTPTNALLEEVSPSTDCECVMLHAKDGYFVEFPLEALRGGLLAYGMNGYEVPKGHGYPVRALVPGHWGETNVKWLAEIEFLEDPADGYWEQKGWRGTGPVETVTKIFTTETRADGRVLVAGPAYAGTRAVDRVEVSTDDGDTWQRAELTEELPGDDVWRQWRVTLDVDEPTTVIARAVDGTGRVQPEEESGSYPSGASGWVSTEVDP